MKKKRIIARLDVKGPNVIKGIQFECLRVMGKPDEMARQYYIQGADELIYLDTVASLYRRDNLLNIVRQASENIFIPFTAGGGIRTINDIRSILAAGAEKVAINTAAANNPELVREAAKTFGSQCIMLSIEAKQISSGKWEAYTDNGRQRTGLNVISWAKRGEKLGAGEILLTSVDMEGTERGFDLELVEAVSKAVSIPVIASGGAGSAEDIVKCFKQTEADAVALASVLHYRRSSIQDIKRELIKGGFDVRSVLGATKKSVNINALGRYDIKNYNKYTLRHLAGTTGSAANIIENKQETSKKTEFPKGKADIGIIDYKINNVLSVFRAFNALNKKVSIVETPAELQDVKTLVLPGVGSFGKGMEALKKAGFIKPLKKQIAEGKPILGICLGMQMLFSKSREFGGHPGLEILSGDVVAFPPVSKVKIDGYKLPHIGWNEIHLEKMRRGKSDKSGKRGKTLLSGALTPTCVYFVHSFFPEPKDKSAVLATAKYGNQKFCAMIQKGNIMGTQFHPEKSGEVGLSILKQFCDMAGI